MPYFSYVQSQYVPKNQLETAIQKSINEEFNRRFIDTSSIETFKENILERLNTINRLNSKCKPIPVSWKASTSSRSDCDFTLDISGVINFHIYKSI